MSQRSGAGSQRSHASVQPPTNISGSQRGAQGRPPVGTVEGRLYKHPADPEYTLDRGVMRLENQYAQLPDLSSLSLGQGSFPSRPGFGTKGKKCIIWTNYYQLLVDKRLVFYQYDIDIQPQAVGRKRARIIELFFQQPASFAMSDKICSDFKSTLLSRVLLADDFTACNVAYRSELDENVPGPTASAPVYHLRLKHTKTLPVLSFVESLTSTNLALVSGGNADLIQAFNIFLNHYAKSQCNLITIGRKTFPKDVVREDLGRGLLAIRGFFSSVRVATGRILVNVDVCCSAFLRPGPLDLFMTTYGVQDRYHLEQFLKGTRVKTSYGGMQKIRTIVGLATRNDGQGPSQTRPRVSEFGAGPEQVEFWFQDRQSYVSVSEFFHRKHHIRAEAGLPVINVGSAARPVYLPAEVCAVMAGQRARGRLDTKQTSKMMSYAIRRPPPARNALSIAQEGRSMVGLSRQDNHLLDDFHVEISGDLLVVPARNLPKPRVEYGNGRFANVGPSAGWNLSGQVVIRPATIPTRTWGWLEITGMGYTTGSQPINSLQASLDSFRESMQRAGIRIGQPSPGSRRLNLRDVHDPQLEIQLTGAAERLNLLYIILPAKHTALYNRIKQICDVKVGIMSICSVRHKLMDTPGRLQYFGNVALKLNLKAGGDNHRVEPSRLHFISKGKTMVLGIDVTHPSPLSSNRAPSIAAVVSNTDGDLGRFVARSFVQKKRQEMLDPRGLKKSVQDLLRAWKTVGGHSMFPENIPVFRDGVSEGQYQTVKDEELPVLRAACNELYDAVSQDRPRITIVIVTKRHHTRFGPTKEDEADSNGNCLAGTVTDRGITVFHYWSFSMQAHSAIQGHARPANYFVVHDEIFRGAPLTTDYTVADTLEDIAQSLHYNFGRCTRAVSYCAPTYHAHHVCERGRRYISEYFDPSAHSETASVTSGLGSEEDERWLSQLQELITPHPRLANKMYWI